jgi:hypothetical protein
MVTGHDHHHTVLRMENKNKNSQSFENTSTCYSELDFLLCSTAGEATQVAVVFGNSLMLRLRVITNNHHCSSKVVLNTAHCLRFAKT